MATEGNSIPATGGKSKTNQISNLSLETVLKRNVFYWENYKLTAISAVILSLISILLLIFNVYLAVTPPSPKFFGTTPDGKPIPLIPLNQPIHTPEAVIEWAKQAIVAIYSLDFVTYRRSLQESEVYFTWKGHSDFMLALKESNNLNAVREKRQVVSVEITGPVNLVRQGILSSEGIYQWDLTLPLTFTYQNSEADIIRQSGIAYMTVVRGSTLRLPLGIAIAQLVFQAR